jgi:putative DNA methylase
MLQSGKANQTRLKTASELKRRDWGSEGFGPSLLRHVLFAVYQTADQDNTKVGLNYLKTEIPTTGGNVRTWSRCSASSASCP